MKIGYIKAGGHVVLWNIAAIEHDIAKGKLRPEIRRMPVCELLEQCGEMPEDPGAYDLHKFPIVLYFTSEKYLLLTGEEQVYKANLLKFPKMDCCCLNPSQHRSYMVDTDKATYLSAVKAYWKE